MLAGVGVAASAVWDYLASRSTADVSLAGVLPVLPEKIDAQAESWRWTQSTGGSTHIEVSAEDFARGADGRQTDLRGVVLKIFHEDTGKHDRVESGTMQLLEDGKLFSRGETVIAVGITDSRDGQDPVVATTSGVTFDPASNLARTDRPVHYDFGDGDGDSLGAEYDAGTGTLTMLGEVRLDRFGSSRAEIRSRIRAGRMLYTEEGARIEVSEGARVERVGQWMRFDHGTVRLVDGRISRVEAFQVQGGDSALGETARFVARRMESEFGADGALLRTVGQGNARYSMADDSAEVDLSGDRITLLYGAARPDGRSSPQQVEALGNARILTDLTNEGMRNVLKAEQLRLNLGVESAEIESVETLSRGCLEQGTLSGHWPSRSLDAGLIRVRYGSGKRIETLGASGDVRLVERSGEGGATHLHTASDALDASFDPQTAGMAELRQTGNFQFNDGSRRGSAAGARFDLDGGELLLEGSATVSDGGSTVSASTITLDRETGRFAAQGDVNASVIQSAESDDSDVPEGLFGASEPVYATADSMISDPQSGRIEYVGSGRMWQGKNRIDAESISIDRTAMTLKALGNVLVAWMDDAGRSGEPQSSVTVRSHEMVYSEATGGAIFSQAVDFRRDGLRVLSDQLRTDLGRSDGDGPDTAVATGAVRIATTEGGRGVRGFADRAEFRLDESEIVLTGAPARFLTAAGTEARGDELTFGTASDSLQISGKGADRAYTYRPPSR